MSAIDQHLENLKTGALHHFSDWPNKDMPRAAAGVYSIWNQQNEFVYVGMAGRGKSVADLNAAQLSGKKTGLFHRLNSHASGMRSGDQFCVYVQDLLILKRLTTEQIDQIVTRQLTLDRLVRDYVRQNLSYRFTVTTDGTEAIEIERIIINGAFGEHPILNPPSHLR
jgi:hypothetical protein